MKAPAGLLRPAPKLRSSRGSSIHHLTRPSAVVSRHVSTCKALRLPEAQPSPAPPTPPPTSSVSSTELSHFTNLASSWWDPYGPSRLLHLMNPLRHQFISECLSTTNLPDASQEYSYLDVGCGGGIFTESAARLPHTSNVTGLDPGEEVIKIARAHMRRDPSLIRDGKLEYRNIPIEDLPPPSPASNGHDIVTLFEVLEHVPHPSSFLSTLTRHLKPGGWLVLSTIARTWTSWLTTKVMAEDVLRVVPRGTHEWSKYVREEELRGWFGKRGGWERPRAMGVVYVPGVGWREVRGGEKWGNYFFGVRKSLGS
ncbi:MAG: Hexaprenyldihydroxybenzoate methyltransferase, mitochondrial [Chrysothrix sp. TS-e1954]|nr:MAG: Hexaprenyldihydroxybenzoate methyltransferase, mitochondrial [Chrysothrix sp. TS-e1954]